MGFKVVEIRDIIFSLAILSFAFAYPNVASIDFLAVLVAVGLGFLLHELAHKFSANKFGCKAEYKAYYNGLGLAVLLAVLTNGSFVFAAPGAVYFGGLKLNKRKVGLIALAGPATNIVLFIISLALLSMSPFFGFVAFVNIWLALFNLLPFGPLDGEKVFNWDKRIWSAVFALAVIGFVGIGFLV
jgi:Zn-dependent protease